MPIRASRRLLACMALAFWVAGCATPGSAPPPPPTTQPYRVGPPDQLIIHILPEPAIERSVVVRPDGMISVDLVGDIPASGRTTAEIAGDIERRIQRFKRDASVTVSLVQSLSTEITVLGEVGRPATFPLARDTRLVEAMGLVGGPRLFAAKNKIRLIRFEDGQTRVYQVNLAAIEQGDLSSNFLLQPGDIVVVPPTRVARVGYWLSALFFPINQIFGTGGRATTTVMTGGASRAAGF
jgi:polysaccharide biosynthesis/export protein